MWENIKIDLFFTPNETDFSYSPRVHHLFQDQVYGLPDWTTIHLPQERAKQAQRKAAIELRLQHEEQLRLRRLRGRWITTLIFAFAIYGITLVIYFTALRERPGWRLGTAFVVGLVIQALLGVANNMLEDGLRSEVNRSVIAHLELAPLLSPTTWILLTVLCVVQDDGRRVVRGLAIAITVFWSLVLCWYGSRLK